MTQGERQTFDENWGRSSGRLEQEANNITRTPTVAERGHTNCTKGDEQEECRGQGIEFP